MQRFHRQNWMPYLLAASVIWGPLGCSGTTPHDGASTPQDAGNTDARSDGSGQQGSNPSDGSVLTRSQKQRIAKPDVSAAHITALVKGNSDFAFDLFEAVRAKHPNDNLIYSPYSISLALAMTYAGAKGDTATQMARTMHYTLAQSDLHPAFNALDQQLASRGRGARGSDGQPFRLKVANSIWGQQGSHFLPSYLDTLAQNYGAGLRLLDFRGHPEGSRETINTWVADQTAQRIRNLLPKGSISRGTRLVLTNAVYFNAAWARPFNKSATHPADFYLPDSSTVRVDMMSQSGKMLPYAEGDGYKAVQMDYDGGATSMLILMPDDLATFGANLDRSVIEGALSKLRMTAVMLAMPKFQFTADLGLTKVLQTLGIKDAFSLKMADFSGMDGARDLAIGDVIHEAFVKVDESGTEAAAATGGVIDTLAITQPTATLTLDHPFFFFIRDNATGTILFVGRVVNPTA